MRATLLLLFLLFSASHMWGQTAYTSYFTGNAVDKITTPLGGVCLMGGATENDEAMKWFLNRCNGGDVLVLRASGADGYNDYFLNQLGITLNSVETIVFNDAAAASEAYIHQKIRQAEGIWLAGGDQWKYISYWRNTPIDSLLNKAVNERKVVIGGTSAGMAVQGKYYFSAQNGTVTSAVALANPYDNKMTLDSARFIKNKFLENTITDTHYDNPDRRGRQLAFMARMATDWGATNVKGIACDEYTAVCIDASGTARVFGNYPTNDDYAYFLQTNCELSSKNPENCTVGTPLSWNLEGKAVKVYKINGDNLGSSKFDLSDWKTATGGVWENWSAANGVLQTSPASAPNCVVASLETPALNSISIYPNPVRNGFLTLENDALDVEKIAIFDLQGSLLEAFDTYKSDPTIRIDVSKLAAGYYFLQIRASGKATTTVKISID